MTGEQHYQKACKTPSDIYQHLPTIRKCASECESAVEFGVRTIVSTWALLVSGVKRLVSVDNVHPDKIGCKLQEVYDAATSIGVEFQFIQDSDLNINLAPTDLLFIDTWHVYEQLKAELEMHSKSVKKYIILHDTETFKEFGESPDHKGLMPALNEFLLAGDGLNWKIHEQFTNCNGLTILKRVAP